MDTLKARIITKKTENRQLKWNQSRVRARSKLKTAMVGQGICHKIGRVAILWFRQLVAALSLLRHRFNYSITSLCEICGQVFFGVLQFSPESIIPPKLHTNLHLTRNYTQYLGHSHKLVKIIKNVCILSMNSLTHCNK